MTPGPTARGAAQASSLASRVAVGLLLALIVVYGALLRFDTLFDSFGPYTQPAWLAAWQPVVAGAAGVMPGWRWARDRTPYEGGDPVNYLKYAREMRDFYQPHVREPVFLASVKAALRTTNDEDVGISLTSIAFSLLMVVATYLVGRQALSPAAGLMAAAFMAVDHEVVSLSIRGWRDEAFAALGLVAAWLWLRLADKESVPSALAAGVATGAACLTRLTAPFMLAPAVLWLALSGGAAGRMRRLRLLGIGGLVAAGLVAPYLVRCAIAYGDPFYAVNYHTHFYLGRAGETPEIMGAHEYVIGRWQARPIQTTDTALRGLFVYPFENKWRGLERWQAGLGTLLAWLSAAGLACWLWMPRGRFLLAVLLGSLVPYMVTWSIAGGGEWRFFVHTYPIYLLASASACELLAAAIRRAWRREPLDWRRLAARAAVTATLLVAGRVWWWGMPYLVEQEALAQEQSVRIEAGRRDRIFLGGRWTPLMVARNVNSRYSTARRFDIRLPLPVPRDYDLVLRIDPPLPDKGPPAGRVQVLFNGHLLREIDLAYDPQRIGSYELRVPETLVRHRGNVLTLAVDRLVEGNRTRRRFRVDVPDGGVGLRFWYVSVTPVGARSRDGLESG